MGAPPARMLAAVKQRLAPNEGVLVCVTDYLASRNDAVIAVAITSHGLAVHAGQFNRSLNANNLLFLAALDSQTREFYREAYSQVFRPVEHVFRHVERIKVVANGVMGALAFDALLPDEPATDPRMDRPLVWRYAFSYPTMLLPAMSEGAEPGPVSYVPPAPAQGPHTDLWLIRKAMQQWAKEDGRVDSLADKAKVLRHLQSPGRIFLAGHGGGQPRTNGSPWTLLGTDFRDTLYPQDLLGVDIVADLVVHMGCNSGLFIRDNNGSPFSFTRTYLFAGARSVIGSLYLSDESSSIKLIGAFRQELAKGYPKDVALQRAKLAYWAACRTPEELHPVRWAGWQLHGEAGKPAQPSSFPWRGIGIATIVASALLFMGYRRRKTA